MTSRNIRRSLLLMAGLLSSTAGWAQAQEAPQVNAPPGELTEIVVTAQRRHESLQRSPLAISAVAGDALLDRNISTVAEAALAVPSLQVGESVGIGRVSLRGIGLDNYAPGAEGTVAVNVDGIYISRSVVALNSFYDVERLEVLRGPQGTLYGRNATGGSINIITRKPTEEFNGYGQLTIGNHGTIGGEGAIGGSVAPGVAVRLSFQTQDRDGYGKNVTTGDDIDDRSSRAVRGQVAFDLSDRLTLRLGGDYYRQKDHSNGYHYVAATGLTAAGVPIVPTGVLLGGTIPDNPRDQTGPNVTNYYQEAYGGVAELAYDLDWVTLRSLTSARHTYWRTDFNLTMTSLSNLIPFQNSERSDQFSQELQAVAESDRNKLVVGLYYFNEKLFGYSRGEPMSLVLFGGPNIFKQGFYNGGHLTTDAGALYAQDTYTIADGIRATLGGRYSVERKAVDDVAQLDVTRNYSPDNPLIGVTRREDHTFRSFTPKVGIDVDVSPDDMAYASYSRGFKSGTYALGSANAKVLKPEIVDAFEVGLKSTLLSRTLRANLAAFYYDYKDLQVGKAENNVFVLENAAKATIWGIEGEFEARPVSGLTLSTSIAYLHARYDDFVSSNPARPGGDGKTFINGVPAFDLAGNRPPQTPTWKITPSAEYEWDVGADDRMRLRVEDVYTSRVYLSGFNIKAASSASWHLVNANLDYMAGDNLQFGLYLKNALDKVRFAAGNQASTLGFPFIGMLAPPRTFGATATYRF